MSHRNKQLNASSKLKIKKQLMHIKKQDVKILKLEARVQYFLSIHEENINQNKIIGDTGIKKIQENKDFKKIVQNFDIRLHDKNMIIKKFENLENEIKEKNVVIKKNDYKFVHELKKKEMYIHMHEKTIENLTSQKLKIEKILHKYTNQTGKKNEMFENEIEILHKTILEQDQKLRTLDSKIKNIDTEVLNYLVEIQNFKEENHELKTVNKIHENASHFHPHPDTESDTHMLFTYIQKTDNLEKEMKIKDKMIEEQNVQIEAMKKNGKSANYTQAFREQIKTTNELHRLKENYSKAQIIIGDLEKKLTIYQSKNFKKLTQTKSNQSFDIDNEVRIEVELQKYKFENRNLQLELSKNKVNSIQNKNHKLEINKLKNKNIALTNIKNQHWLGKTNYTVSSVPVHNDIKSRTARNKNFEMKQNEFKKNMEQKMADYTQQLKLKNIAYDMSHITNKYTKKS